MEKSLINEKRKLGPSCVKLKLSTNLSPKLVKDEIWTCYKEIRHDMANWR